MKYLEQWLPTLATDSEDDTVDPPAQHHRSTYRTPESREELQQLRQMSLQNSFSEIRSQSSPEENMYVIENITILQRDIRNSNVAKRDINSLQSESEDPLDNAQDENFSPARKKNSLKKMLFDETASYSSVSLSLRSNVTRPPLLPLDMNRSQTEETSFSRTSSSKENRTAAAKHKKTKRMQTKQKN
jgi:hypothetical protein